jgi:ATP-dependent helicase Lhr and Lhr-like helicase
LDIIANVNLESQSAFGSLEESLRKTAYELGLKTETEVQSSAIPAILAGENVLVISPTGSGKTEAALLPIFQQIVADRKKGGIRAIYVTPLRALNRDILKRITQWGERLDISVQVRHGDTPQKERTQQSLKPPEILITTPETLQVLLVGPRLREGLANLEWVVVDEIHDVASDRRGSQLTLGLERIEELLKGKKLQRIGLSATISNSEDVAKFLVGSNRTVSVVDQSSVSKLVEYRVEMPEADDEAKRLASELFAAPETVARIQRIIDLVRGHYSTLIFVNSRTLAEYLSSKLMSLGLRVGVHHGSLPREERERVELDFKSGKIQAIICTSTMELGIDIGSVDLVIQYMSPRQVNSLVQRVGRSGHTLKKTSEGVILSVSPEDAIESIATIEEARLKNLEPVAIHEAPLDVLAHQIAGLLLEYYRMTVDDIASILSRAHPYRSISPSVIRSVANYMNVLGYLRIEGDRLARTKKCREYYLGNLSMIPDERRYNVIDVTNQQKVGILGEEFMMLHAKVGVHFIVKGHVWQIESIQEDRVYVTPVKDPTAAVPGWDGELMPIPEHIARHVAHLRGRIESELLNGKNELLEETKLWNTDKNVRESILDEVEKQAKQSAVPTDRRIVVEKFERYLIIHTSTGDKINDTLGELFEEILLRKMLIRHWWADSYRILIELTTDEFDPVEISRTLFEYNDAKAGFLSAVIRKHFPFGYYLKFIAERFGALKRGMMLSDGALKELVLKFRFTPIYEETLREALMLRVDLEGSLKLLKECNEGRIEVRTLISEDEPSPLGMYVISRYAEPEGDYAKASMDTVGSMREAVSKEVLSLLCFNCACLQEFRKVGDLDDEPKCKECGSNLLAPIFYGATIAKSALEKKKKREKLSDQDLEILTRARRSADIVLSYGKLGVIAQCVYGVGPQTASKVLSRMHTSEDDLYMDLLEAKLNFIRTRQFWE